MFSCPSKGQPELDMACMYEVRVLCEAAGLYLGAEGTVVQKIRSYADPGIMPGSEPRG